LKKEESFRKGNARILSDGGKRYSKNTKVCSNKNQVNQQKCPHPQPMTHAPAVRRDALPAAMYVAAAA